MKTDFEIPGQILQKGSEALPDILLSIKERYNALTAAFVALQLEYPSEW
jgi:hypothetical protein